MDKYSTFRRLHESGCFVIPNPWDVGSARYLQRLGFKALATTSAGAAWTMGFADGHVPRDRMLAHIRDIVEATDLPVSADFEGAHAHRPEDVADSVRLCIETGVAGLSVEDFTGDRASPLYDLGLASERIRAAREAIDASGRDVLLVGRAEGLIRGRPDFEDVLRRLRAYSEAGADCLYAPGVDTPERIKAVVDVAAPKPVNVLVGQASALTVRDLAELGVRRISLGSALARVAWGALMRAAKPMAEAGSFEGLDGAAAIPDLNALFPDESPSDSG